MKLHNIFTDGFLRGLLAVAFSGAIIGGFFTGIIDGDVFIPIAVVPITYYFARKQTDDDHTKAMEAAGKLQDAVVRIAQVNGQSIASSMRSDSPFERE